MGKTKFWLAPVFFLCFLGCKKTDSNPSGSATVIPPSTDSTDLLRDSLYLYSKEVYLWHDVIPSYAVFNPRQYSGATRLAAAQNEMAAIRALQVQDNKHSYSFVTTKAGSDAIQTGNNQDYGFFVKAASIDKVQPIDSVHWYVEYVYQQSSPGLAGAQRGWYISKINGSSINYDNASIATLNDVFFGSGSSAVFSFVKPDGSTIDLNLSKSSYTANSVLFTNVFTNGSKKIGYVVFNQFFGTSSQNDLTAAFNDFGAQGITDLVVDLRYNHGGSTDTQNKLAGLIAPSSANGKTMYTYIFNDALTAGNFPLLRTKPGFANVSFSAALNTVNFVKSGSLSLPRVLFIVSSETASASELLINNLRPYMDVKLIGDTTYGKPVGFFPIPIFDYAIYPISFKTVNSAGSAEYYDGFVPDKIAADGVSLAWGDSADPCLAAALQFINTGSFNRIIPTDEAEGARLMQLQKTYAPLNHQLSDNKFTGMFLPNAK